MKTSLVVKRHGKNQYFSRASVPEDSANWISFTGTHGVPMYCGPQGATEAFTNRKVTLPENVTIDCHGFRPEHGKINPIRRMDYEFIARLETIDAERAELRARLKQLEGDEQDILEDAYLRGKPIAISEVKQWHNERRIAREAKAAATAVTMPNE